MAKKVLSREEMKEKIYNLIVDSVLESGGIIDGTIPSYDVIDLVETNMIKRMQKEPMTKLTTEINWIFPYIQLKIDTRLYDGRWITFGKKKVKHG